MSEDFLGLLGAGSKPVEAHAKGKGRTGVPRSLAGARKIGAPCL